MTTKHMLLVIALLLPATGACVTELGDADPAEASTVEQGLSFASMSGNCYASGGYYWCQDYYTSKWCTSSYNANGWDWKDCSWDGWNASGTLYCSNGWQWGASHVHCD